MALRLREHVQRGRVARALRSVPHPGLRQGLLGKREREHPSGQGVQPRRLPQRRAPAPALHLRNARQSVPAQGRPLEREALQVEVADRDRRVRRPASHAGHRGLAGGRRLRARLGTEAGDVARRADLDRRWRLIPGDLDESPRRGARPFPGWRDRLAALIPAGDIRAPRSRRRRQLLHVHVHQLDPDAALRPSLGRRYRGDGLVMLGVHTPEFSSRTTTRTSRRR